MMGVQTAYNYGMSKGVAGGLYDLTYYENNTFATPGGIPFGYGVVKGANPGTDIKLPDAESTEADFEGVTQNGFTVQQDMAGNAVAGAGSGIGVLKSGKIWAVLGTAAEPAYGKQAYLITEGAEAGRFTTAEDGTGKIALHAEYVGGKDGGLAPVRI